jgi:pre-mRNA-splicing factor CDC5/CEF1
MRAERQLLPPIELTLKQMDTSGTELECFQALQRQEQLAASHRINGLWEEVQKQKELEQTLQRRYGDLVAELERIQQLIINYRALAIQQEEIAAKNRALELAEAATKQAAILNSEPFEPVTPDEHGNSMPVGSFDKKVLEQQMDVDSEKVHSALATDTSLTNNVPSDEGQMTLVQGNGHEASGANPSSPDGNNQNGVPVLTENSINRGDIISTVGVAVEIKVNDASVDGDAGDVMSTEIMDGLASVEGESIQERADDFDKADMMEVSSGGDDKVNQKKDEGKLPVIYVDLTNSD